jgi:HSF-type DNA-binding
MSQLNFYGFRKMQSKPIRNSDFDAGTAKHVTFYNENFKRGRCDLLKKIQRSTRGGGTNPGQDQERVVQNLKDQITTLENTVSELSNQMEERMRRLELDMLGRMEQMMLAMQQHQQTQLQIQQQHPALSSSASTASAAAKSLMGLPAGFSGMMNMPNPGLRRDGSLGGPAGWDPLPYGARATSIGSLGGFGMPPSAMSMPKNVGSAGPTLPPHPKQKSLPPPTAGLPAAIGVPPSRFTTLRGISNLSRGISNLSRGASIESASSVLLRNTWEDKFFSMLMLGEHESAAAAAAQAAAHAAVVQQNAAHMVEMMHPTPMGNGSAYGSSNAAMVSNSSSIGQQHNLEQQDRDMGSVSSQDLA